MEYFPGIKSHKSKFILSLISAIFYQFGSQIVITTGSLCVYFISYIHHKYEWVNMHYGNITAPIIMLLLSSFSPLSGIIEKKIGSRFTLLLSSILVEICFLLYYFQRNLYLFYTISIFIGIGTGLSAGVPIKNACKFYPKHKGKINSLIICLGGLINSLYSYIGEEKIINPNKTPIEDKKTKPFYPPEVANRAKRFFIFAMIIVLFNTIISLILFYKFKPDKEENSLNNTDYRATVQKENETDTKKIIKTFRFWRNMIIVSLMPFWVFFLTATYRAYSPMLGVNQKLISKLPTITSALNSLFGLIWAFALDQFGFQIIIKLMSVICIVLSVYFLFIMDNKSLYIIGLFISTIISRVGIMSVINPHIMQVYEFRNYLIIGGFARLFHQLSFFLAALTSVILSFNYKTADSLEKPYKFVASIGIILSIIGLIFSFFENDEKFNYRERCSEIFLEQNNNEDNKEIEKEKEPENDERNI